MINKVFPTPDEAVANVFDGATIMFGGFGSAGHPLTLIEALARQGARSLTIITNQGHATPDARDLSILLEQGQIKKAIMSFPVSARRSRVTTFERKYVAGEVELEMVPQGTLAERIRAAGAGIPAFYTPTGIGTIVEEGKEKRVFDGRECLMEKALGADFALVKAHKGDRLGNLIYRKAARNFNPPMAMAAKVTIAEVDEIMEVGQLYPEVIVTPGIFVQRVVKGVRHPAVFLFTLDRERLKSAPELSPKPEAT